MIDIHSHILAGLDDGASTSEEAVAMVRMAAAAGTTDIVASPHADSKFTFNRLLVESKIDELQQAVGDNIRIHYGCDFHLTPENVEEAIADPEKYSINHRGYLLIEFSDLMVPASIDRILDSLITAGLRPIVTHPERNPLLRKRMSDLDLWVQKGCLVQVTAQSLLGGFGKSAKAASDELMRRGLVHFLASDGHDCRYRPPVLDEVWRFTAREYGEERAQLLLEVGPRAALTGAEVPLVETQFKKKSWFSRFL
jgi:protein-tyrosine phosphatase